MPYDICPLKTKRESLNVPTLPALFVEELEIMRKHDGNDY
jgi:hypothetical protein